MGIILSSEESPRLNTQHYEGQQEHHENFLKRIENLRCVARKRIRNVEGVLEIIHGLEKGWNTVYPGKYKLACWFILKTEKEEERCVVKEFLPEGTKIFNASQEEEYEAWRSEQMNGLGMFSAQRARLEKEHGAIPPWYPVVSLGKVLHVQCERCGTQHPVIETYVQTYDSPEGDTWRTQRVAVCGTTINVLSEKFRDN